MSNRKKFVEQIKLSNKKSICPTIKNCRTKLQIIEQNYKLSNKTINCQTKLQIVEQNYKLSNKTINCRTKLKNC
jgi:hypothetical protein